MQYILKEWQSPTGSWFCEHTDSFPRNIQKWVVPARVLGIPADEYVKMLIKDFKPDFISFDGNTLIFSWKKQSEMRKYKNWINKKAREKGYQI